MDNILKEANRQKAAVIKWKEDGCPPIDLNHYSLGIELMVAHSQSQHSLETENIKCLTKALELSTSQLEDVVDCYADRVVKQASATFISSLRELITKSKNKYGDLDS